MTTEERKLRDLVASTYRILLALGQFDFAGDASARIPGTDTFLIRRTRVDLDGIPTHEVPLIKTTPRDIIKLDLEGNQLDGDEIPPWEMYTHIAIYRARPDVHGIVHSHAKMVTAFSMVGRPIDPVYLRGVESTGNGIPIYDDPDPVINMELGESLVAALGKSRACMMRSHGLVTVGSSIQEACVAAINLEQAATMQWIASALGDPRPLPAEGIKRRQKIWDKPVQIELVFRYYEQSTAALTPATHAHTDAHSTLHSEIDYTSNRTDLV